MLLVNHETVTVSGPVPSVVMSMVALAVVGPVCWKADTATFLTAGAAGEVAAEVVGVAGVDVVAPLGDADCVGKALAEAGG
jgi:hypothetical protein